MIASHAKGAPDFRLWTTTLKTINGDGNKSHNNICLRQGSGFLITSISVGVVGGAPLLSNNPQIWIINFTFAANIENAQWQHCTDAAVLGRLKLEWPCIYSPQSWTLPYKSSNYTSLQINSNCADSCASQYKHLLKHSLQSVFNINLI